MDSETYNMLALGGLLIGKLILLSILICYCCKTRRQNLISAGVDSADQTDVTGAHLEAEKELRKQVEQLDKPPQYTSVVLRIDPPEYMESVINAQINPELNRRWAEDFDKGEVDQDVRQIISRSRENSITSYLPDQRGGPLGLNGTDAGERRNTLAVIPEFPCQVRTQGRTRTYSTNMCTVWIGH